MNVPLLQKYEKVNDKSMNNATMVREIKEYRNMKDAVACIRIIHHCS